MTVGGCFASEQSHYSRWEVYEDSSPGIWYHMSEGLAVRYQAVQVNVETGELIKGDPVVSDDSVQAS